ncbi:hypothetical protein J8I29_01375 [Labrys sp. LIt4]|uniref:hypothetical protein n=1 Tax=Labrys sp. LIt4 TaxID=2821355 RepID=UPI001AE06354|nr:hypothetical protein [Labrys sp. LIt4]MBP0577948.1 hypothetical protein [Labrys sp. LIt4]
MRKFDLAPGRVHPTEPPARAGEICLGASLRRTSQKGFRTGLAGALCLAAAAAFIGTPAKAYDYMALGVGTMPCKYWLSTTRLEGEGNSWILGWWTGLNSRNDNHWVGSRTDGNGIILAVKGVCQHQPDMLLMNAIDSVFKKMASPNK